MLSGSQGCFFECHWSFSWAWKLIFVGSSGLPLCQSKEKLAVLCLGSEAVPMQMSQNWPWSSKITDTKNGSGKFTEFFCGVIQLRQMFEVNGVIVVELATLC